jgi:hypothetical protein
MSQTQDTATGAGGEYDGVTYPDYAKDAGTIFFVLVDVLRLQQPQQ